MFASKSPKHLVFLVLLGAVIAYFGVKMYHSLAPPRHADHDHAMASLDAGGFLRVEGSDGRSRNLVGRPGRVLVLHFFDPASGDWTEPAEAARFAAGIAADPTVEVAFVARAESWNGLRRRAETAGIPADRLYLDENGETSRLLGVRRWPETLVYAPDGLLAYQAMGPMNWRSPSFLDDIERARGGVREVRE